MFRAGASNLCNDAGVLRAPSTTTTIGVRPLKETIGA
jgi:hypothetical protein